MAILDKHLIVKTDPLMDANSVIKGDGFRISVLTESLFRVEISASGRFVDSATQYVWYRNWSKPPFTVAVKDKYLTITTEKVSLSFNKLTLRAEGVVFADGKKASCNNSGNLKGTYRTLDQTNGKRFIYGKRVKLNNGVISKDGVAIIEDDSLFLNNDGQTAPRDTDCKDYYIFAYGNDYRAAIVDFYNLTGGVPLVPRYALGNWWSRYHAYTQQEYIDLMQRFIDEDVPITVATIDMDWHWVDVKNKFAYGDSGLIPQIQGTGWTGYSWNTDLFPDYKGFLKWLKDRNLRVTMNLHPAQGVRWFEDMYQQMADELGFDTSKRETIPFDISSADFINAYFKVLHKPYERSGVDFWWIDWQQGSKSKLVGLDPLWALNHYHFYDIASDGDKRPLILSRYAGNGSHRYPLGFSGDTVVSWKSLDYQPFFTANAANIGYTWWSHDIGGHMFGIKDDELYLRWVQFGVFSPVNRLHSTSAELMSKEPWKYRGDVEHYAKKFLRLRHRMIPYIYSMNYRTYSQGIALCEPMYYTSPDVPEAYKVPNEYMFGSELIVCPITSKIKKKTGLAGVKAYIPEGRWTDIFTGYIYNGGCVKELFRDETSIPVLAKAGAIIPLSNAKGNDCGNPTDMTVAVYRGNGHFDLYEDEGNDMSYLKCNAITRMTVDEQENKVSFEILPAEGDLSVIPSERDYAIAFKDIVSGKVRVFVNGEERICDTSEKCLKVMIKHIKSTDKVQVLITNYSVLHNPDIRTHTIELLSKMQGKNLPKMGLYPKFKKIKDDREYAKAIITSNSIPLQIKKAVIELL